MTDLLQLDKIYRVPNLLREKWAGVKGYDPLKMARGAQFLITCLIALSLIAMGLVVGAIFYVPLGAPFPWPLTIYVGVTFFLFIVLTIMASRDHQKSEAFMRALEELSDKLCVGGLYMLHTMSWKSLSERAESRLIELAMVLLNTEAMTAEVAQEAMGSVDRVYLDELHQQREYARKEFDQTRLIFFFWNLAEEKWDRYFDIAKASILKKAGRSEVETQDKPLPA